MEPEHKWLLPAPPLHLPEVQKVVRGEKQPQDPFKITGKEEDEDEDEEESHICLQDPCQCGGRRKGFI